MEEVVRFGTIFTGEERIGVMGIGRNVKIGAIHSKQTESLEKDRGLCFLHEQMEEGRKGFGEKSPPSLYESRNRNHIRGTTEVVHDFTGKRPTFEGKDQGDEFFQWKFSFSGKIMTGGTCKEPGNRTNGTDRAIERLADTDSLT